MKCYSYKNGKITSGITHGDRCLKTCAVLVKFPESWNLSRFLESVRCKEYSDIFLHACVELIEGDSITSVFPEGCAVVNMPCPVSFTNHRNMALELDVTDAGVLAVLPPDSSIYDKDTERYISNVEGKLHVDKVDLIPLDPEAMDEGTHYIEF